MEDRVNSDGKTGCWLTLGTQKRLEKKPETVKILTKPKASFMLFALLSTNRTRSMCTLIKHGFEFADFCKITFKTVPILAILVNEIF